MRDQPEIDRANMLRLGKLDQLAIRIRSDTWQDRRAEASLARRHLNVARVRGEYDIRSSRMLAEPIITAKHVVVGPGNDIEGGQAGKVSLLEIDPSCLRIASRDVDCAIPHPDMAHDEIALRRPRSAQRDVSFAPRQIDDVSPSYENVDES